MRLGCGRRLLRIGRFLVLLKSRLDGNTDDEQGIQEVYRDRLMQPVRRSQRHLYDYPSVLKTSSLDAH